MSLQSLADRRDFLARCSRCSQCKTVVSVKSQRFASSCPSVDWGHFHAYSASGQIIAGHAIVDDLAPWSADLVDAISSCTMCGNCDVTCKINYGETIEPLDTLYALRARMAADGQSPEAHQAMLANIRSCGNSAGHPAASRGAWAEGLPLAAKPDVLIHVGSTLAFDPSRRDALRAVAGAISDAGFAISCLGVDEGSSGAAAFDLGFQDEARALAQAMARQALASGAATLVTFSAQAIAAFRGTYPRLGVGFGAMRVLHISEFIDEQVKAGKLRLGTVEALGGQRTAYHDSCKLGRLSEAWQPHAPELVNRMNAIYTAQAPEALRFGNGGCYEAPRSLLRAMGAQLVELERSGAQSYCCGACGGVKEAQPEAAALAASNRLDEFAASGAAVLVSACSGCTRHMAAQEKGQVRDLLDLLAQALIVPRP